jgi:hypothetical protein
LGSRRPLSACYGCRPRRGTESCVAANNLNNGDAFRFQSTPSAASVGQIRFGNDPATPADKPPFAMNGTGLVKNLNADPSMASRPRTVAGDGVGFHLQVTC